MYIIRRMSESSQLVMLYKARKVFNNHKEDAETGTISLAGES